MKRFAIACVAVVGLMAAGSSAANAGGFGVSVGHGSISVGHGYSNGHSSYSNGHGSYSSGYNGGHGYTPRSAPHYNTYPTYRTHGYGYTNSLHGGYSGGYSGGHSGGYSGGYLSH